MPALTIEDKKLIKIIQNNYVNKFIAPEMGPGAEDTVYYADVVDNEELLPLILNSTIKLKMPALKTFVKSSEAYQDLLYLLDKFGGKKPLLKYLKLFEHDAQEAEFRHTVLNHRLLLNTVGAENMYRIMENLHAKQISVHNFVANLFRARLDEETDPDGLTDFIINVMSYSESDFYKALQFANYKKVRYASNKKAIMKHIDYVNAAKGGYVSHEVITNNMLMMTNENYNNSDIRFLITKEPNIVNTIGSDTNCCFRPGGLAGKLLAPAMRSPISGIIHGTFSREQRARWFSFIWEYVEKSETSSLFNKHLVLDNVESNAMLKEVATEFVLDKLKSFRDSYKSINLGYSRNDITESVLLKESTSITRAKKTHLIGYAAAFNSSYDDSKHMYTVLENDTIEHVPVLSRMNPGDLMRALYIEAEIYKAQSDFRDLSKLNTFENPCYIIQSKESIFGYLLTRIKYFKKDTPSYEFSDELSETQINKMKYEAYSEDEDANIDDQIEKVLFIEDIFIQRYKNVMHGLIAIKDDIIKFCKENGITTITACTNKYSKPFTKRLIQNEEGINYVEIRPPAPVAIMSNETEQLIAIDKSITVKPLQINL